MEVKKQDLASMTGKELMEVKSPKPFVNAKSGSLNRYVILDSVIKETKSISSDPVEQIEENIIVGCRKARAASSGVADLMKSLKPRKKGPIDKGNKVKAGSSVLGGQSLSHSL